MKMTFTKDYQPTEEVVRSELNAAGLPAPESLEVTGSVIEATFAVPLTDLEIATLRETLAKLGYFLNK